MLAQRLNRTLTVLAAAILLAGCRTPARPVQNMAGRTPARAEFSREEGPPRSSVEPASYSTPQSPQSGSGPSDPLGGLSTADSPTLQLTLEEAVQLSLQQNPDLSAIRSTEPAARAALRVAETYPYNPQFQTQVLPYTRERNGTGGPVSQQHVVVQTFELGGQQQYREGGAAATWQQVHYNVQQAELMNEAQTTRLYFTALYQRELRDLSQTLAELNEQLAGVIGRREKAGQATQADVALAKIQARASRRQQRLSEANYQTALLALRTQLRLAEDSAVELTSPWEESRWQSVDEALGLPLTTSALLTDSDGSPQPLTTLDETNLRALVSERPDVVAARSAVRAAQQNLQLANAMRRPSLQAGPMFQRDNSATVFWGLQGQIDIPVVNTGMPLVRQRRAELRSQQVTAAQLEQRAVLEARAAILRYERARRLVEESRSDLSPDMADSGKAFEDQFRAGQVTILQVFAARATLAQSRASYFDLLNEVCLAAADVTQAVGLPAERLRTTAAAESRPLPVDSPPSVTSTPALLP